MPSPSPLPAELFGSRGFDADVLHGTADGVGEVFSHGLAMRADFGLLTGDGAIGVHELVAQAAGVLHHLGK